MKEAKSHLKRLVYDLCVDMKGRGVAKHIHFQGSSYEGIKTMASDLEFDCLIVLEGKPSAPAGNFAPGYKKLLPNGQGLAIANMCEESHLSPNKIRKRFQSELQRSINTLGRSDEMKLRSHGPAIQIDVYRGYSRRLWYSVDMVPGFQVVAPSEYHVYVAKSYKSTDLGWSTQDSHLTWRRSFSIEEKNKFKAIDRDGGCRKAVVRMVKVLREIDAPLKSLPSYVVKTVVMNINESRDLDWSVPQLGKRFVDVLAALRDYLCIGYLSHHFFPGNVGLNLLEDCPELVRHNMWGRLTGLLNSQQKMMKVLQPKHIESDLSDSNSSEEGFPDQGNTHQNYSDYGFYRTMVTSWQNLILLYNRSIGDYMLCGAVTGNILCMFGHFAVRDQQQVQSGTANYQGVKEMLNKFLLAAIVGAVIVAMLKIMCDIVIGAFIRLCNIFAVIYKAITPLLKAVGSINGQVYDSTSAVIKRFIQALPSMVDNIGHALFNGALCGFILFMLYAMGRVGQKQEQKGTLHHQGVTEEPLEIMVGMVLATALGAAFGGFFGVAIILSDLIVVTVQALIGAFTSLWDAVCGAVDMIYWAVTGVVVRMFNQGFGTRDQVHQRRYGGYSDDPSGFEHTWAQRHKENGFAYDEDDSGFIRCLECGAFVGAVLGGYLFVTILAETNMTPSLIGWAQI